jgi:hypothetical protein
MQRLETDNMTLSLDWMEKIAAALEVRPVDLLADLTPAPGTSEAYLEIQRDELIRARFKTRHPADAPLAFLEAAGRLAEYLSQWGAGDRPGGDVVRAAAGVSAAAQRIGLDVMGEAQEAATPVKAERPRIEAAA